MPERYFLKTPSKPGHRNGYQIEQERLKLSGTTTTSQVTEITKYAPWLSVIMLSICACFIFGNTGGPGGTLAGVADDEE